MELDRYIELILTGEATVSADTLVQLLHAAADAYTNVGVDIEVPVVDAETLEIIGSKTMFAEPFITDDQFNQLELLLKATDPSNHYFLEVGSEVRGGKVELPFRMGSLDQLYAGDAEKWIRSNGWLDVDFVLSDKYDGTSGSIIWDHKGALKVSHSRGNGIMGADITRHVRRMPVVPQRISQPIATRNEFIMRRARFTDVQGQIASRSGRTYKNARNFVAGKMNASESEDIFYDNISVVVTSVVEPKMGKSAGFELCRSLGMEVADYVVVKGRDINDAMLSAYLDERRSKSPYELDGIVIDVDDADIRAQMRKLDPSKLNPAYSAKYKTASADNNAVTEVVAVHWRVSKAGYLKPRVEIQPVDLMGVTITYATGFNAAFIRDGGIGPGAKIQITRAGDVIPYITRVIEPAAAGASMPTAGQFGAMEYTEGDVDLYVLDVENNAEATLYRIIDAFKTLDVPFLRQGSVEKLVEAGFDSEAKIIRASLAELQAAVGQSAGEKIHEGLKLRLNPVDMATLMGASQTLGRGMGVRKSTRLLAGLGGSLDNLPASPVDAAKLIASIEGFEKKTATSVVNNMPRLHKFLASIEGFYTVAAPKAKVVGGDLADVTVVFTGVRDKDLEAKIAARGGTIGSSVNKNTTHLVCKDPTASSSKLQKARELLAAENILDLPAARALWGA